LANRRYPVIGGFFTLEAFFTTSRAGGCYWP